MNWKKAGALSAIFVVAAGLLTGCESGYDAARKPELVEHITGQSLEKCQLDGQNPAAYKARLSAALGQAYSESLDVLIAKDVTVCLDQRLPNIEKSWYQNTPLAVYYNNEASPVLTLYDNGKLPQENGFFETGVDSYSGGAIDKIAEKIAERDFVSGDNILMAGRESCGKNCSTTRWRGETDGWGNTGSKLENNPGLRIAPVR